MSKLAKIIEIYDGMSMIGIDMEDEKDIKRYGWDKDNMYISLKNLSEYIKSINPDDGSSWDMCCGYVLSDIVNVVSRHAWLEDKGESK